MMLTGENENVKDDLEMENKSEKNSSYLIYLLIISLISGVTIFILTLVIDNNVFMTKKYVKSDNDVIKPQSDFRKYRTLLLNNGLQVLLISDPLSVKSGASLSVRVGANSDPNELLGLAHFCEHMLFLGSDKYPHGDDYFKSVTENNGHFNAYTDREITNYFFDIHYLSFEKALDIFSRFFIDPLFKEEKMNKEINSVNSEFEKNLIIDSRKRSQVFAHLINKENHFHRFTTGNKETLIKNAERLGLNLRDELIKFHKNFYVANKMKLVIFSKHDLDDMEEIIAEKFSDVKSSPEYSNKMKINPAVDYNNLSNKNTSTVSVSSSSQFKQLFNETYLGSLVKFNSLNLEHEIMIHFIHRPLSDDKNFNNNPYYYFYYILESKEENSLIDLLKKKQLANKISVLNDRDYYEWSDFVITINLTKHGMNNLDMVFQILKAYLTHMKNNLINEKNYKYLQTVSKLNFEYKSIHSSLIYEVVSKLSHKLQKNPLNYILDEIHLVNSYNEKALSDYANSINLENSIMFIPDKNNNINLPTGIFVNETNMFEPWYRTNFTIYKINFDKLNQVSVPTLGNMNNHTQSLKFQDEISIKKLIENLTICDSNCIYQFNKFNTEEPSLLNKTNNFEFWYKKDSNLDFNKLIVNMQFNYEKFKKIEDKVHLLILEIYMKRKIKKINSNLKFFSNTININHNKQGLKITFSSFNVNIIEITKELIGRLNFLTDKKPLRDFQETIQELHDHLVKEYNSQPWQNGFEHIKKQLINEFLTSEDYLKILKNINEKDFSIFLQDFHKNYYLKLFVIGDIIESDAREIFQVITPILKMSSVNNLKSPLFSIEEKRKNRKKTLKYLSGNYLTRKEYHQETNKNSALIKCFKIGKTTYKNEFLVKLFNTVIGNIVFRELRINKQFGYTAKSRVEILDDYFFYCLFVQGSSKLPHVMDDAAIELLQETIKKKLDGLSNYEFNSAKRKTFDIIANTRLDLSKTSQRYFTSISENTYKFYNFDMVDKFSMSIVKDDLKNFFIENFVDEDALKFTSYIYSKQIEKEKMKLKATAIQENSYEELKEEN